MEIARYCRAIFLIVGPSPLGAECRTPYRPRGPLRTGLAGTRPPRHVSTDWRSGQDLLIDQENPGSLRRPAWHQSRLAIDATAGLTDLVEAMHHNIARVPGIPGTLSAGPTRGITGWSTAASAG